MEGDQLPNATIVASLNISLRTVTETQMPKMLGPKVRVIYAKTMVMRAMVVAMVRVMGRTIVGPIPMMPMSSRGIQLISLRGIHQVFTSLNGLFQGGTATST